MSPFRDLDRSKGTRHEVRSTSSSKCLLFITSIAGLYPSPSVHLMRAVSRSYQSSCPGVRGCSKHLYRRASEIRRHKDAPTLSGVENLTMDLGPAVTTALFTSTDFSSTFDRDSWEQEISNLLWKEYRRDLYGLSLELHIPFAPSSNQP